MLFLYRESSTIFHSVIFECLMSSSEYWLNFMEWPLKNKFVRKIHWNYSVEDIKTLIIHLWSKESKIFNSMHCMLLSDMSRNEFFFDFFVDDKKESRWMKKKKIDGASAESMFDKKWSWSLNNRNSDMNLLALIY